MGQVSRESALKRIDELLNRLSLAASRLPRPDVEPASGTVSRETVDNLLAAHRLLRDQAAATVARLDDMLEAQRP